MLETAFCIQTQQVTAGNAKELESADRGIRENLQISALRDRSQVKEFGNILDVQQTLGRESRRESFRGWRSHSSSFNTVRTEQEKIEPGSRISRVEDVDFGRELSRFTDVIEGNLAADLRLIGSVQLALVGGEEEKETR